MKGKWFKWYNVLNGSIDTKGHIHLFVKTLKSTSISLYWKSAILWKGNMNTGYNNYYCHELFCQLSTFIMTRQPILLAHISLRYNTRTHAWEHQPPKTINDIFLKQVQPSLPIPVTCPTVIYNSDTKIETMI